MIWCAIIMRPFFSLGCGLIHSYRYFAWFGPGVWWVTRTHGLLHLFPFRSSSGPQMVFGKHSCWPTVWRCFRSELQQRLHSAYLWIRQRTGGLWFCLQYITRKTHFQMTMWDLSNGKLLRTIADAHPPGTAVLHVKVSEMLSAESYIFCICLSSLMISPLQCVVIAEDPYLSWKWGNYIHIFVHFASDYLQTIDWR